ncbi:MAG: branched-chain amino acid aminotransferase [Flavobacteriales bacterium]|nr:branched-chain amino acid aminotransferase [Flavobacteriales bacterium]MCB0759650.1 branched-chain amino acid aminotransferase [Flavobacteriales bacterium]
MISTAPEMDIKRIERSRLPETDLENLKFGRVFTDHMFLMDHVDGAWQRPQIMPFGDLELSPATLVLHYAQTIFEGMKAYRNEKGEVALFRPQANIARMNRSANRMCMPELPEDVFLEGLKELVRMDGEWLPEGKDAALYIRPFMFASDEYIGVKPSDGYRFMIFMSPVRGYYQEPLRVRMELKYSRAFPGGTGEVKCGGNYAGGLYPSKMGQDAGYHQLLWTDAMEHKYIEESGTMNVFFIIDGVLTTPSLDGTILPGITRDSILALARGKGMRVEERKVTVDEVVTGIRSGKVSAAFGAGTAVTIAPIRVVGYKGEDLHLPELQADSEVLVIGKLLDDIRRGRVADTHGWVVRAS